MPLINTNRSISITSPIYLRRRPRQRRIIVVVDHAVLPCEITAFQHRRRRPLFKVKQTLDIAGSAKDADIPTIVLGGVFGFAYCVDLLQLLRLGSHHPHATVAGYSASSMRTPDHKKVSGMQHNIETMPREPSGSQGDPWPH